MLNLLLCLVQLLLLFFLSRQTINELFYFLRLFFKNEHFIFSLVSLIFLPGTILHEMSHFFMAISLFLKVRDVRIFPEKHGNTIKLGMVTYEKQDFIRGILVGIAPVFFGFFLFFVLAYFKFFPSENIFINLVFIYLIFVISSTMFSSKQDLVDLIFIIPLVIIALALVYIFNIDLRFIFANQKIIMNLNYFSQMINYYLLYSLIINVGLILFFKSSRKLLK